jgi:hypothetical protein
MHLGVRQYCVQLAFNLRPKTYPVGFSLEKAWDVWFFNWKWEKTGSYARLYVYRAQPKRNEPQRRSFVFRGLGKKGGLKGEYRYVDAWPEHVGFRVMLVSR